MKKYLLFLAVFFIFNLPVLADGTAFDDIDTTNYADTAQGFKAFSQKDYEDAINQYKNHFQKPKKVKEKDKKYSTTPMAESSSNPELKSVEEILNHKATIMIPAVCETPSGQKIFPGHYSLSYEPDNSGQHWLILSQGSVISAKIFPSYSSISADESTINYAYARGKDDVITLFYGNIDAAVEADLKVIY